MYFSFALNVLRCIQILIIKVGGFIFVWEKASKIVAGLIPGVSVWTLHVSRILPHPTTHLILLCDVIADLFRTSLCFMRIKAPITVAGVSGNRGMEGWVRCEVKTLKTTSLMYEYISARPQTQHWTLQGATVSFSDNVKHWKIKQCDRKCRGM